MQQSSPSPTGQTHQHSNLAGLETIGNLLLCPFFVILLLWSQVSDCGRFLATRFTYRLDQFNYKLTVAIDTLPLSFTNKYRLMMTAAWLPTIVLAGIAVYLSCGVISENIAIARQKAYTQESLENYTIESRIINASWPEELQESTQAAQILLSEDQLLKLTRQYNQLSNEEIVNLSQAEKINLALVYYYYGNQTQYQHFLQEARIMDPNDRIFAR
ncbi:hypothetical protein IJJ08_02720 [bacterium]|nr:hypothetical protein [bacterium]